MGSEQPFGHNGPSFDDIVRENLDRGFHLSTSETAWTAIDDLRVSRFQLRVLRAIARHLNSVTGVAFPGRKLLAEQLGCSEGVVGNAISGLIAFGYLVSERRQPQPGSRPLAHYALTRPSVEELQAEIAKFIEQKKSKSQPGWRPTWASNVTPVCDVTKSNVTPVCDVKISDVTPVYDVRGGNVTSVYDVTNGSDVTNGGDVRGGNVTHGYGTVTGRKKEEDSPLPPTGGEREIAEELFGKAPPPKPKPSVVAREVDQAFEIYNRAAKHFEFSECRTFTDARRKRLTKRLADIGGLDKFRAALRALKRDDSLCRFLLGKTPSRPGEAPFRLDIDRLMQTDGGLGDVLAKLSDMADEQVRVEAPPAWRSWTFEQWTAEIAEHANGIWPKDKIGFWPGHPSCEAPPEVIASLGLTGKYDSNGIKRQ
jgi:hypothetical protein